MRRWGLASCLHLDIEVVPDDCKRLLFPQIPDRICSKNDRAVERRDIMLEPVLVCTKLLQAIASVVVTLGYQPASAPNFRYT